MNPISLFLNKLDKKELSLICFGLCLGYLLLIPTILLKPQESGGCLRKIADIIAPNSKEENKNSQQKLSLEEIDSLRWLNFDLGYTGQSLKAVFKCKESSCSLFFMEESNETIDRIIDKIQKLGLDRRIEEDLISVRSSLLKQTNTEQLEGISVKNYQDFQDIEARIHKAVSIKFNLPDKLTDIEQYKKSKIKTLLY